MTILAFAGLQHAKNIQDWEMLGNAVDFIIDEQREFVAWWRGAVRHGRGDKLTPAGVNLEDAQETTGISQQQVSRWSKALKDPDAYRKRLYGVEYAAAMGLKSRGAAKRAIKEAARRRLPRGDCILICGDIADVEIPPGTVDLILTDPPYPQKYLPVYGTLAKRAAEWLKPGGSLLCMCGQSYLPDILGMMTTHIRYHWIVSYLTPGGQSAQMWERRVTWRRECVKWRKKVRQILSVPLGMVAEGKI